MGGRGLLTWAWWEVLVSGMIANVVFVAWSRRRGKAGAGGAGLPCRHGRAGAGGGSNGSLLEFRFPCGSALNEILYLLGCIDVEHSVEHLLRGFLGTSSLVDLEGLELGEDVAEVVNPLLILSLEGLKDERSLRLPLLGSALEPRGSLVDLLCVGFPAFFAQPVRLILSLVELFSSSLKVGADGVQMLHLLFILKAA